jgi:WD40 repeat protein
LLQRQTARREESTAASVALAASGNERLSSRPAQALLLGVAGFDESPTAAARSTAIKALQRVRSLGVWEILHSGAKVTALGFGRRSLGVGYADGTVRQWDVRARNELRVLRIPGGSPIVGVSSASKTEIVVAASKTGHLRVWNARNGHPIRDLTAPGAIVAIGVSDDGRLIAAFGGGDRVWLWDTRTRRRLSLAAPRGSTANVAFSARGRILAVSVTKINYPESDESTVRVWNTETGARMWTLPTVDIVDAVAFDATGKLVTAGFYPATRYDPEDAYGEVAVWDVQRRVRSRIRTNKGADRWIGFTRGGRTLLVSVGQAVRTAAPSRSAWLGTRIAMLGNYPDWFAVSSDGHFLATAAAGETDVEIRNLRVRHLLGRVVRAQRNSILLGGSTNDMGQLAATGYGIGRGSRVFFVAAHDRAVSVASWLATPSPSHVAFSGDVLAVQSDDGSVDVWSVASRTRIASLPPDSGELLGLGNNVLTFDASHRLLAEGVRTAIRVLDIRKQRLVGPPIKIHDAVAAGFTHDGRTLRTVSNGFLESWDVIRGRRIGPRIALLTLPQPAHVIPPVMAAFDSTGDLVAVAPSASQDMFIWDARKRVPVAEFPRASYSELASAFSPDSRTVAVPGSDLYRNRIRGRVQLWDVRSGTPLGGPLYAAGYMRAVAFSAHGRILVTISDSDDSGSANGSDVHFWPLEWLADLRREACRVVIGGLTEDEWRTIVPELRYRKSC